MFIWTREFFNVGTLWNQFLASLSPSSKKEELERVFDMGICPSYTLDILVMVDKNISLSKLSHLLKCCVDHGAIPEHVGCHVTRPVSMEKVEEIFKSFSSCFDLTRKCEYTLISVARRLARFTISGLFAFVKLASDIDPRQPTKEDLDKLFSCIDSALVSVEELKQCHEHLLARNVKITNGMYYFALENGCNHRALDEFIPELKGDRYWLRLAASMVNTGRINDALCYVTLMVRYRPMDPYEVFNKAGILLPVTKGIKEMFPGRIWILLYSLILDTDVQYSTDDPALKIQLCKYHEKRFILMEAFRGTYLRDIAGLILILLALTSGQE